MSYNIRYDNPNDAENWWEYRKSEVAQLISYYTPEILGIQEGKHHQVSYLDSVLLDYSYVGVGRDDGITKGEYTAIFYNAKRLEVIESETYWLSETPHRVSVGWDASMERIATFATFVDSESRDTFHVLNAHFDHIGPIARARSAEVLLQVVSDRKLGKKQTIVMGDLNCGPDSAPMKLLTVKMKDSYLSKDVLIYGPEGTFSGFDIQAIVNRRIDYILVKNIDVTEYRHIDDRRRNNLYPSDHLPVFIKFN